MYNLDIRDLRQDPVFELRHAGGKSVGSGKWHARARRAESVGNSRNDRNSRNDVVSNLKCPVLLASEVSDSI